MLMETLTKITPQRPLSIFLRLPEEFTLMLRQVCKGKAWSAASDSGNDCKVTECVAPTTWKAFGSTRGSEHGILLHSGRSLKWKGYKRKALRHPDGSVGLHIEEWQIEPQDTQTRMRTLVCVSRDT